MHAHAVWEDGDAIEDATVTATPTSPSGEAGDNIQLEHTGDGTYSGTLSGESGDWSVEVTLFHDDAEPSEPTVTETITVGEGGGDGGATDTTAAEDTGSATEPADGGTETAADETAADEEDDGGGGSMVLIIILVVVVLAVVGAVFWAVKGRGQEA